jgi:hypothetical protein
MKRAILREYDQYGEDLSGHCARFSYRLMNLCVKAEEVSLLPIEILIEDELVKLEECCVIAKKDEYSFMVVPNFEEDLPKVCQGVLFEHPEFKQDIEAMTVDSVDEEGKPTQRKVPYLLLTMPKVNNERYKVLKDGVKALYNECKAVMELTNTKADMKFAPLLVGESEEDLEKLKKLRDKLNADWTEHREQIYHEKLQEIEDAHNMWMADRVEETLDRFEKEEGLNDDAARTMKLSPEDE